mmetsp:Transcript_11759/g.23880  ORF Transcript_11759/g.23880 Transcript_11759/m.23880 type:complete len:114 (-) Transcript_11759:57-398(-)
MVKSIFVCQAALALALTGVSGYAIPEATIPSFPSRRPWNGKTETPVRSIGKRSSIRMTKDDGNESVVASNNDSSSSSSSWAIHPSINTNLHTSIHSTQALWLLHEPTQLGRNK